MIPVDFEGVLVAALNDALPEPFATRVPSERPVAFGRVRRTGGTGINLVQEKPMVLVECWAPDSVAAFDLAARAYGVVDTFCSVGNRPSSPINNPDPDAPGARYQFTATPVVDLKETA